MSTNIVSFAAVILREFYGEITSTVGKQLILNGLTPLGILAKDSLLKIEQVKKALCVLIQENLAFYNLNKKGFVEYAVELEAVLARPRFPLFIYSAKTLYGDAGELIVEELLQNGRLKMDDVIERVFERMEENPEGVKISMVEIHERFKSLAQTRFIQRCPAPLPPEDGIPDSIPQLEIKQEELFNIPHIDIKTLMEKYKKRKGGEEGSEEPKAKRAKKTESETDEPIYWRVNLRRFQLHICDRTIVAAVENKHDKKASEVIGTILRICETSVCDHVATSPPVTAYEVHQGLRREFGLTKQVAEQYLVILSDESCPFISRIGDSGGGTYSVNYKTCITMICEAHIESVVLERFGSKCLRIFRLLKMKKRLEQKQIEEFAMIPAKEAKEMLYKMFGEQFVGITEVPKTPDHAPSRTFYVFHVNINQVVRMVLDLAYKAAHNLMIRRECELKDNRRLLDKHQRVEAIAANLEQSGATEEQRQEIEEMITPPERVQLEKVQHMTRKLELSEIEVNKTIFVLEMYLIYDQLH